MKVTRKQFESYLKVQKSGKYNMFDPKARKATGLEKRIYLSIIDKYGELYQKFSEEAELEELEQRIDNYIESQIDERKFGYE
jgi:hypothetical protein